MTFIESIRELKNKLEYLTAKRLAEFLQSLKKERFVGVFLKYILTVLTAAISKDRIKETNLFLMTKFFYDEFLKRSIEVTHYVNSIITRLSKEKITFYTFEIFSRSLMYSSTFLKNKNNIAILLNQNEFIEFVFAELSLEEHSSIFLNFETERNNIILEESFYKKTRITIGINQIIDFSFDFSEEIKKLLYDSFEDAIVIETARNHKFIRLDIVYLGTYHEHVSLEEHMEITNFEGFIPTDEKRWKFSYAISRRFLKTISNEVRIISLFEIFMKKKDLKRKDCNVFNHKNEDLGDAYKYFLRNHAEIVKTLNKYFQVKHLDLDALLLDLKKEKFKRYFMAIVEEQKITNKT